MSLDRTKEFKNMPEEWRIEAVIHDGEWYDINKWRKVAKVKEEQVIEWIKNNEEVLIKSDTGSYRVEYDDVIAWYAKHEIPLDTMLIPKNFPPKLWGNLTEAEAFIKTPRRRTGTISFLADNSALLEKCRQILSGIGLVIPDKSDRYKAYGLSSSYMKSVLSKELTKHEFDSLELKTRTLLMQRELFDFPERWLVGALEFYVQYAKSILAPAMSTLTIYLPRQEDRDSQIVTWVIIAMKKFDETKNVPFSGYLSTVLRHWPYDLPDEFLGKELSDFQRKRNRAIKEAQDTMGYQGQNVPHDVIAELIGITINEYVELIDRHETWLAEKNATTLTWEDSSNEKAGVQVGFERKVKRDLNKLNLISMSVIKATLSTKDYKSGYRLIETIDSDDIDNELYKKLSNNFISKFGEYLAKG